MEFVMTIIVWGTSPYAYGGREGSPFPIILPVSNQCHFYLPTFPIFYISICRHFHVLIVYISIYQQIAIATVRNKIGLVMVFYIAHS